MENISSRSSNKEIAEAFNEQLQTGKTILYSLEPTANPEYLMGYFIQKVKINNTTTISGLALGWDDSSLIRTMQNFKAELINDIKVGDSANKIFAGLALKQGKIIDQLDINIKLTESHLKKTWINKDGSEGEAQPKVNPTTSELILVNGEPVYRYTELVNGKPEHVILKPLETTAVQPAVKNEIIAAKQEKTTFEELLAEEKF